MNRQELNPPSSSQAQAQAQPSSSSADQAPLLLTPSELATRLRIRQPPHQQEGTRTGRIGILQHIATAQARRDEQGAGHTPLSGFYAALTRTPRAPTMRPSIPVSARLPRMATQRQSRITERVEEKEEERSVQDDSMDLQAGVGGELPPLMPRAQRVLHEMRRQHQGLVAPSSSSSSSAFSRTSLRVKIDHTLYWNSAGSCGGYALVAVGTVLRDDNSSSEAALVLVNTLSRSRESAGLQEHQPLHDIRTHAPRDGTVVSLSHALTLTSPTSSEHLGPAGHFVVVLATSFSIP
ncbi:hypothetical protein A4X13_0g4062 [Tilletia indica]|uniref:Uncharacterized protein n=1 Tax=Tilletia indica TaxID=43049 RepID=A0A177TT62_9BASI|nr:hypothetical protein A4X13_0g4062 [Tilletia indica]